MTVEEIIKSYLEANGLDGLVSEGGDCACSRDDLAPCGNIGMDCEAGHRVPCTGTCDGPPCDFHIMLAKKPEER